MIDVVLYILSNEAVPPIDSIFDVEGTVSFVDATHPTVPDDSKFLALKVTTTVTEDFVIDETLSPATPGS